MKVVARENLPLPRVSVFGEAAAPGVAAVRNRPLPGSLAPVRIACRVDLRELPIATHVAGER